MKQDALGMIETKRINRINRSRQMQWLKSQNVSFNRTKGRKYVGGGLVTVMVRG